MSAGSLMLGAAVTPLNSTDAADQSGVFDAQAFVMREAKIPIVGEKGFIWLKTSID